MNGKLARPALALALLALVGCDDERWRCQTSTECPPGQECTSSGKCWPMQPDMGLGDLGRPDLSVVDLLWREGSVPEARVDQAPPSDAAPDQPGPSDGALDQHPLPDLPLDLYPLEGAVPWPDLPAPSCLQKIGVPCSGPSTCGGSLVCHTPASGASYCTCDCLPDDPTTPLINEDSCPFLTLFVCKSASSTGQHLCVVK